MLLVNKHGVCIYRATLHGIFDEHDFGNQFPISEGFRIVSINGQLTLADTEGAFSRVEKHLKELGRM